MINMGLGYSKKDQRRVSERNAPHKTSVTFATQTNVQLCSPLFYDIAYSQTYTNTLTKLLVNNTSKVFLNYASRYSEYKVDSIDLKVYYNPEAPRVNLENPPVPQGGNNADTTFQDAFFHFLYNPEKDDKPGEQLGSVEEYDKLTAHPSTQIFRWRPPVVGDNTQRLTPCFSLRVKPKIKQSKLLDGVATTVYVNHPFIPVPATKDLYCGGLWVWTTHEIDQRFAPLFFTEITYNFIFRDSQFPL